MDRGGLKDREKAERHARGLRCNARGPNAETSPEARAIQNAYSGRVDSLAVRFASATDRDV